MNAHVNKCKGCGVVFEDANQELDKCTKKRLYCELCLAQKNPRSETERRIRNKYILITALTACIILVLLIALNWGENKNDKVFEQLVVLGFGYILIWGFTSLLLMPVLMMMKKPHKKQINREKEKYAEELEVKKKSRKALLKEQERARTEKDDTTNTR